MRVSSHCSPTLRAIGDDVASFLYYAALGLVAIPEELHSGCLSYASSYVDPETRALYAATTDLAEAYEAAVAVFERHLVRVDGLWVGKLAKEQLDQGELVLDS